MNQKLGFPPLKGEVAKIDNFNCQFLTEGSGFADICAVSRNFRNLLIYSSEIEVMLMKELWSRGLRYRKNVKTIFGKPDIAFIGKKVAVFCDSEFWHGYNWEERKHDFKSHQEFWIPKIERNMERDKEVTKVLEDDGWTVLRFWGKEIKKNLSECADIVEKAVRNNE